MELTAEQKEALFARADVLGAGYSIVLEGLRFAAKETWGKDQTVVPLDMESAIAKDYYAWRTAQWWAKQPKGVL